MDRYSTRVGTITENRHGKMFVVKIDHGEEIEANISNETARLMFRLVPGDRVIIGLPGSANGRARILGHHRHDLTVSKVFRIERRGTCVFFCKDPDPWWPVSSLDVTIVRPNSDTIVETANVELARKVPPGEVMALLFPNLTVDEIPIGSLVYRSSF